MKRQIFEDHNDEVYSLPSYFETTTHSFHSHVITGNEDEVWQHYLSKNAPGDQISVLVRKEDNFPVMCDSIVERETNDLIVQEARGDVLMIGLGINLVNDKVLANPLVMSVTVIEKYADIIEHVPTKCNVIHGDANVVELGQYDTIWIDPSEEVTRNFRLYLKQGGRVMYWDADPEINGLDQTHVWCPDVWCPELPPMPD